MSDISTQAQSRNLYQDQHLQAIGVSELTVLALSPAQVKRVLAELDRFYAFGYGEATKALFMSTPHPELTLQTPAEALSPTEIDTVIKALHSTLKAIRGY